MNIKNGGLIQLYDKLQSINHDPKSVLLICSDVLIPFGSNMFTADEITILFNNVLSFLIQNKCFVQNPFIYIF